VIVMYRTSDLSPHAMFRTDGAPYTILIRQVSSTVEVLYVYSGVSATEDHISIESDGFITDDGPAMYKGQWAAIG